MKSERSIPGFSAIYSFSNQSQTSFGDTTKVTKTTFQIIPAMSCDACNRVCNLFPIWDCLRCLQMCDPKM